MDPREISPDLNLNQTILEKETPYHSSVLEIAHREPSHIFEMVSNFVSSYHHSLQLYHRDALHTPTKILKYLDATNAVAAIIAVEISVAAQKVQPDNQYNNKNAIKDKRISTLSKNHCLFGSNGGAISLGVFLAPLATGSAGTTIGL